MRAIRLLGALVFAVALVVVVSTGNVGGGIAPLAITHPARIPVAPFAGGTRATWASSNWSGYAETGHYSAVSASWTVPTVTPGANSGGGGGGFRFGRRGPAPQSAWYSATWTGIDGFNDSNLIQTGTEQDFYSGSAHYSAWWEILPAAETVIPSITVKPGDTITVSITKVSASQWSITLTDKGSNVHAAQPSFSTTQSYSGPGASAEWILEAPTVNGHQATLASYGSAAFDPDGVNGQAPGFIAGSGGELVQGSFFRSQVVSIPSGPDTGPPPADGFAVAYGSTSPPAPSS